MAVHSPLEPPSQRTGRIGVRLSNKLCITLLEFAQTRPGVDPEKILVTMAMDPTICHLRI